VSLLRAVLAVILFEEVIENAALKVKP
jgi:hypothetical protein